MITKNFEDYPEHRLKFFSLLRAIATHCFPALVLLSSQVVNIFACGHLQYVVTSCMQYLHIGFESFRKL